MNKAELIASVAEKAGLTKKDAEKAVVAIFDSIQQAMVEGDKVRAGRNPRTNETIQIPASKNPVFKAGKALKDAVNA